MHMDLRYHCHGDQAVYLQVTFLADTVRQEANTNVDVYPDSIPNLNLKLDF